MQITRVTQTFTLLSKWLGNTCPFIIPRSNRVKRKPLMPPRERSVGPPSGDTRLIACRWELRFPPTTKSEKPLVII